MNSIWIALWIAMECMENVSDDGFNPLVNQWQGLNLATRVLVVSGQLDSSRQ